MGLDLVVSPIQYTSNNWWLCYNRLSFNRSYQLFSQIVNVGREWTDEPILNPLPVPKWIEINWYWDEGIETITENPYGEPLTYLTAGEFCELDTSDLGNWNSAVVEFLCALPRETPVLLYWK